MHDDYYVYLKNEILSLQLKNMDKNIALDDAAICITFLNWLKLQPLTTTQPIVSDF